MVIRKATREQIETALADVNRMHDTTLQAGLSAYGNNGIRPVGRGWALTLKLESSTDPFHRHGARTITRDRTISNNGCGKRMTYVCWHGHREFMRALYRLAPDATIRTGLATYKGARHFEETHEGTAWGHDPQGGIGSLYAPLAYSDACDCERGECPSRKPGRIARVAECETAPPEYTTTLDASHPAGWRFVDDCGAGDQGEHTVTPEETLRDAGVDGERWSDYNRKFNELLNGRAK